MASEYLYVASANDPSGPLATVTIIAPVSESKPTYAHSETNKDRLSRDAAHRSVFG